MNREVNGTSMGNVSVDNEVIKNIALKAATDINGVYRPRRTFRQKIAHFIVRKDMADGVRLEFISESELKLSLKLTVEYGVNIPYITGSVQENVKRAVEYMTGLTVSEVAITITEVNLNKDIKLNLDFEGNADNPVSAVDDLDNI